MSRTRYKIYEEEYPYFMTGTIVAWLPVFAYPSFCEIILDSWRYLQKEGAVRIFGYVIMENHLHWIALGANLSEHVGRFKSFTARQIINGLEKHGFTTLLEELRFFKLRHKIDQMYQLWQEGSHPQQIKNDEMMRQKLEYLHLNPVRRGYVDDPLHWRYSSSRNYAKMNSLLQVETEW